MRRRFLAVSALGHTFKSPIGLAAGFDKDGRGYNALAGLGFGFVEVGTVTAQAQPGNPKPRLFRLPKDRALINRMGFNNAGAAAMSPRLTSGRPNFARSSATTRSLASASSVPPPSAVPLTAAIVGLSM